MKKTFSLAVLFLLLSFFYAARAQEDTPYCYGEELKEGLVCRLYLSELLPTQYTIGMEAVTAKKEKIWGKLQKGRKKLEKYLQKKKVPVILGPRFKNKKSLGEWGFYMIDRHHTMSALLRVEQNIPAFIEIIAVVSPTDYQSFWKEMYQHKWFYNKAYGKEASPAQLPSHLQELKDDPFRSLSWRIREEGCYENLDTIAFQEFYWADFFRVHMRESGDMALGIQLATSQKAAKLPGFKGHCHTDN